MALPTGGTGFFVENNGGVGGFLDSAKAFAVEFCRPDKADISSNGSAQEHTFECGMLVIGNVNGGFDELRI